MYNQKEMQTLLQKNRGELVTFASEWLRDHRDYAMRYENCRGEKLTFTHYARMNGIGVPSWLSAIPEEGSRFKLQRAGVPDAVVNESHLDQILQFHDGEVGDLRQFSDRLNLESVDVFRASNETPSWYVELSFQGGSKWPYGLIYIPDNEPLNMLNAANGGPGPGFSAVVPLQGRWLFFESR